MSHQRIRHFAFGLIFGLVPLLPPTVAQAAPAQLPAQVAAKPLSASRIAEIRDSGPPEMEQASRYVASAPLGNYAVTTTAPTPLAVVSNPRLYREVFGFAYASSIGDPNVGYPSWNMSLLSTVAYFGLHVDWTGNFSNDSGYAIWNNAGGPVPGLISTAHAAGTKVVLTIIMMDGTSGTPNMCSALQRAQITVNNTVAEINAKGVDGVNIDYESNNSQCTDPGTGAVQSSQSLFTSFVAKMRAALPAGSYLSVDTYSGSAGFRNGSTYLGFFDISALASYVDSFFVMAYDMEYSNWDSPPLSCPSFCISPTAPLTTYLYNDSRAASEYSTVVPPSQVIMGIPYYGRKECVAGHTPSNAPPNAMGDQVKADGYQDASGENGFYANSDYQIHREVRDVQGNTRWDTFYDSITGCTREMYWDDVTALGNKYDLVINTHLRGIGIWTLSYGGSAPELWSLINLKFGQCSQAAISADHSSPQIPATGVTFHGTALCAGTATFRFWMQPPGGTFSVVQDYSTSNTLAWDTTNKPLGTYTFQVDARNQGSTVSFDTQQRTTFRLANCVTPTLGANPASPQLPGTAITLTTSVTCNGTPEYQFSERAPGATWTVVRPYGAGTTFAWNTTGAAYGGYSFMVSARNAGTTIASESTVTIPYSLTSCISAALSTDKATPQPTGSLVTVSASATCVSSPQYRFSIQSPSGASATVQDFSSATTYAWSAGGPAGIYTLQVDAKQSTAPASTVSTARTIFELTACTGSALVTSPSSPQEPGPTVLLTGSAACQGAPQYRFWIHKPDGTVGVVQDYSPAATYSWNTKGLAYGQYGLRVDVRNTGSTSATETIATQQYMLQAAACTAPTATTTVVSPQGPGAGVNFTAATTTCPQPVFQFWVQAPGQTTWTLGQAYSANPTFHWVPSGLPAGTYKFSVWAKDATRPGINDTSIGSLDAYLAISYTYAPCTSAGISTTGTSALAGSTVTVTGTAAGCAGPLYEFWTLAPGSTWKVAQAYSSSSTFNWSTAGPLPPGLYRLGVWVRDSSSPGASLSSMGASDAVAGMVFSLTTQPCTSVTISSGGSSSATAGATVIFTGTAAGCPGPLYEFWLRSSTGGWQMVKAYSSDATYSWNTSGLLAGTYYFGVWAKDGSSSTPSFDANGATAFVVNPASCASATLTPSPASPIAHGTGAHVTFTATASGCTHAGPLFEFWMFNGTSWQVVQGWSTTATYDWDTTGKPAGIYQFGVWVRDAASAGIKDGGSMGRYDTFAGAAYRLT